MHRTDWRMWLRTDLLVSGAQVRDRLEGLAEIWERLVGVVQVQDSLKGVA